MRARARRQELLPTINLAQPSWASVGRYSPYDDLRYCTPGAIEPSPLPAQLLSDLLWSTSPSPFLESGAAIAVCAKGNGAAAAIDLYLVLAEAIYFYCSHAHQLVPVVYGDFREDALAAGKPIVKVVPPVQLIYVAGLQEVRYHGDLGGESPPDLDLLKFHDGFEAGLIAGRVLQFAAEHGLVTWFHDWNRERLNRALSVGPERRVLFVQTIACAASS